MNQFVDHIHPSLHDEYVAVVDCIFDIRLPHLINILAEYHKYKDVVE